MNTQTLEENPEFIQTMQSNLSKPQTSGANGYQRRYNSIDYSLDQKIDDFSYPQFELFQDLPRIKF